MKINKRIGRQQKKAFFVIAIAALALGAVGAIGLNGKIWADRANMTSIWFNNALFCQRVSQAINDSLGDGMADGSDCVNRNLYVSTPAIEHIETLNIVPPEGGFGDIDWSTQSIGIGGSWTTVFYNLTSLTITNMPINNIEPLRALAGRLTYLDLSYNRIDDITPLKDLKDSLVYLDISGNPIYGGIRELSRFKNLETLKYREAGTVYLDDLFRPDMTYIDYDPETGAVDTIKSVETDERLTEIPLSSNLAKSLRVLDISNNPYLSFDNLEPQRECVTNSVLYPFKAYPLSPDQIAEPSAAEASTSIALTELYMNDDDLNADDIICVSSLENVEKLDISHNHIDDFSAIKDKPYTIVKADSQSFIRSTSQLDYSPLPNIFTQAGQENYFSEATNSSNVSVALNELDLDNATFNGADTVRFINAAIASEYNENPQPATITVPGETGVFENSKLEVYFTGEVITFHDTNLCNEVYRQGDNRSAFYDINGIQTLPPDAPPVVLTNACNTSKQIAMISGGSGMYLRLILDSINDGANVDLTGLETFYGLQLLSLQDNAITDITPIENSYALQQLFLNDNQLSKEDWPVITNNYYNLGVLYLNNNHMTEISEDLSNLGVLGNLYLVNNGISDVSPLADVTSLTVLDLSENGSITDFSGMVGDEYACNPSILKMENNGITSIPDSNIIRRGFSNLTSINLNGNSITSDTIANLATAPRLDELYLNNNSITTTTEFSNISMLKKLFLDNNQIENISGLISLPRLAELHLNGNQIDDLTGLDTAPALATLDVKNQTLTGTTEDDDGIFELPAVFSQAKTMNPPKVNGFSSSDDYITTNGTVNYDDMTATMLDTSSAMTVTIPDGGLAGTTITVTYEGTNANFAGDLVNNTNNGAIVAPTSASSFTVTSDKACMALWSQDNGTTWERLTSNIVPESSNMRAFNVGQPAGTQVLVMFAGDANRDKSVNIRDARKIINSIIGNDSLSNLEANLADVDGKNGVNVRDARAIINSIMGSSQLNW